MKKVLFIMLAMFAFKSFSVCAQDAPLSIETGHPDFTIKIKKCIASGKTVFLEMQFINKGIDDVNADILMYNGWSDIYDSEGVCHNYINDPNITVRTANSQYENSAKFSLIAGVPVSISVRIEGVPLSAEYLARVRLWVRCSAWGLVNSNKKVIIRNIPISR